MFWLILLLVVVAAAAYFLYALTRPKVEVATEPLGGSGEVLNGVLDTRPNDPPNDHKEMTHEDHLDVAYWAVMTDLQPDIPLSRLNHLKPKLLSVLSSGSKAAGSLICSELADIPWDCPAWIAFPKSDRGESVSEAVASIGHMKAAEILESARKNDLQELCKTHAVRVLSKATKPQMIAALGAALSASDFSKITEPFRARLISTEQGVSRKEMAEFIALKISRVAYNAHRYEQLSEPEFAAIRPFWKFIWVDYGDAPRACKKFDGKILPIEEAKKRFPHLPCNRLRCNCRLHAVATKNG